MLDLTRQQIADRRASRRERIAELGEGHRRAKLLRDMLRLVAKAAAEFIEEHPPGECPCEFCTGSEAAVANTAEDIRTAGGMARMAASAIDMAIFDALSDRGPRDGIGAELRRLARQADAA